MAGNVGSAERLEYTVIGDTVNMVARVEALNKEFGTGIILTPETQVLVKAPGLQFRSLGAMQVRGREGLADLFTLAG